MICNLYLSKVLKKPHSITSSLHSDGIRSSICFHEKFPNVNFDIAKIDKQSKGNHIQLIIPHALWDELSSYVYGYNVVEPRLQINKSTLSRISSRSIERYMQANDKMEQDTIYTKYNWYILFDDTVYKVKMPMLSDGGIMISIEVKVRAKSIVKDDGKFVESMFRSGHTHTLKSKVERNEYIDCTHMSNGIFRSYYLTNPKNVELIRDEHTCLTTPHFSAEHLAQLGVVKYVEHCGKSKRPIFILEEDLDVIHIGCFKGTKEEAIDNINLKYTGQQALDYIAKVNECFDFMLDENGVVHQNV